MTTIACPVSGSQASTSSLNTINACPASIQLERVFRPTTPRASSPTKTRKILRDPGNDPLLYLPPLLSLLPTQEAQPPSEPFSFADPKVGYTKGRLPSIDAASVELHKALHRFRPTTEDYAYEPYEEAFNWHELELPKDIEREWYIVAFRSVRAPDSPSRSLYQADKDAHEEAVSAGGLLAYWYGVPKLDNGANLATCIWQSRRHAVLANSGPKHIEAMRLAAVCPLLPVCSITKSGLTVR